jgi:hypothetical protein
MDVVALLAIAGLAYAGQQISQKKYQKPTSPPVTENYTAERTPGLDNVPYTDPPERTTNTRILYERQGEGQPYGGGIQTASPNQILIGSGLPQIKKNGIPSFQVTAPNTSRDVYKQSSYDLLDISKTYMTDVQNGVSPVPKILVGPGLGVGPDVASSGGFHQDYRILTPPTNYERTTTLPGVMTGGTAVIPHTPLSASTTSTYAVENQSDLFNGIMIPSVATHLPERVVGTVDPTPDYTSSTFVSYPTPAFEKSAKMTLKDQIQNPGNYGQPKYQIPFYSQSTAGGFQPSADNRSQKIPNMNVGVSPVPPADPGMVKIYRTAKPGDYVTQNGSASQQYVPLGLGQTNPYKDQMNPYSSLDALSVPSKVLASNPYSIKLYST